MDELRRREALAEFEPKLRGIKEIPRGEDQIKLYEVVADKIGREVPIRYLEFGVFDLVHPLISVKQLSMEKNRMI